MRRTPCPSEAGAVTAPAQAHHRGPMATRREGREVKGVVPDLPRALPALANEARGRRGLASPFGRAGDHRRHAPRHVVLAGRALHLPYHGQRWGREPSSSSGQQRTATENNIAGKPARRLVA
jgi:hypothetical protein